MGQLITFADVNIIPDFSEVPSRSHVDLSVNMPGFPYMTLPVISANMDTVTEAAMARAMITYGGQACIHRFGSIQESVELFGTSIVGGTGDMRVPLVSIGLGPKEIERAEALRDAGACTFVIDVNHGANIEVVKQTKILRQVLGRDYGIVVGNFATAKTIERFLELSGNIVDGFKIGIGGGSTCTTRIKTGVGIPQLSALIDCRPAIKKAGVAMIADGAMKTAGDVAKALAAGAHMVMTGGMLAGTDETPGELVREYTHTEPTHAYYADEGYTPINALNVNRTIVGFVKLSKKYRGSASHESYLKQGKVAKHRAAEGESFSVPYKGPVMDVLQDIEGGLRGSLSMVGAFTINEFHNKAELAIVSQASALEAQAHGKTK